MKKEGYYDFVRASNVIRSGCVAEHSCYDFRENLSSWHALSNAATSSGGGMADGRILATSQSSHFFYFHFNISSYNALRSGRGRGEGGEIHLWPRGCVLHF